MKIVKNDAFLHKVFLKINQDESIKLHRSMNSLKDKEVNKIELLRAEARVLNKILEKH